MSQHAAMRRLTAPEITARKGKEPIVSLTSYHAHTAAIADKYVDFLLVGDSLGMVMHGFESTLPVPLDLMILHGRAVMRGAKRALVVVDMPFGSYEESPAQAFRNAAVTMGCPSVIIAHTVKGKGVPYMENVPAWHGSVKMNREQTEEALRALGGSACEIEELMHV